MKITETFRGFGWRLIAAVFLPLITISVYLLFTRWPSYRFTAVSDYAALGFSVLVGAMFLATLPIRTFQRALSLLVYVPVVAILVFLYMFGFIALVFHDGL